MPRCTAEAALRVPPPRLLLTGPACRRLSLLAIHMHGCTSEAAVRVLALVVSLSATAVAAGRAFSLSATAVPVALELALSAFVSAFAAAAAAAAAAGAMLATHPHHRVLSILQLALKLDTVLRLNVIYDKVRFGDGNAGEHVASNQWEYAELALRCLSATAARYKYHSAVRHRGSCPSPHFLAVNASAGDDHADGTPTAFL